MLQATFIRENKGLTLLVKTGDVKTPEVKNSVIYRHCKHFVLLFLSFFVLNGSVIAESEVNTPPSEKVDAILLMDRSGSMLVTDPLGLRFEGAKLFTQFLKKGDRLAIVSFADSAEVIRPLSDFDPSQIDATGQMLSQIPASGEYTDLAAGIDKAVSILANNHRADATPTIILLSDGKMEPPPAVGSAQVLTGKLIDTTLPDLKKQGQKIFTLAFSDQADKDLLQEIAAVTDGISWYTPTADKIHESFASLFLAVKKPQIVPMTKKGFKIDTDIQEATFYINREDATGTIAIVPPDGNAINAQNASSQNIRWFSGQKFEVVTINTPPPGDWQISGVTNQDGFATVLTKVRLVSEWPTSQYAQSEVTLEARLFEDDKPIVLPEMSDTIQFAFQISPTDKVSEPIIRDFLVDDGTHGDKIAKDGIFSRTVQIEEAGEYKLRVLAKAPTFERNQQLPFRVKPPFIQVKAVEIDPNALEVPVDESAPEGEVKETTATEETTNEGHEDAKQTGANAGFEVILNDDLQTYKKFSTKIYAVDANRTKYELPLIRGKNSKTKFYAKASELPKKGTYTIKATVIAETKKGAETRTDSRALEYEYVPPSSEPEKEVAVVKKEAPKKDKPASPILPIILMTLLNGGASFGLFKFMTKKKAGSENGEAPGVPKFTSTADIEALLERLKAMDAKDTLDLNGPIFSMAEEALPALWEEASGALDAEDGGSAGADNGPAGDAAADATEESPAPSEEGQESESSEAPE